VFEASFIRQDLSLQSGRGVKCELVGGRRNEDLALSTVAELRSLEENKNGLLPIIY